MKDLAASTGRNAKCKQEEHIEEVIKNFCFICFQKRNVTIRKMPCFAVDSERAVKRKLFFFFYLCNESTSNFNELATKTSSTLEELQGAQQENRDPLEKDHNIKDDITTNLNVYLKLELRFR